MLPVGLHQTASSTLAEQSVRCTDRNTGDRRLILQIGPWRAHRAAAHIPGRRVRTSPSAVRHVRTSLSGPFMSATNRGMHM